MLIANPERLGLETVAAALEPAPVIDILAWAEQNIVFDEAQFPGPYFWDAVLQALGPEDPCRYITVMASALGGQRTSPEVVAWAMAFAQCLGKEPIKLNAEANGHMINWLQFALVREAVACLLEGMASANDIDKAVTYGLCAARFT